MPNQFAGHLTASQTHLTFCGDITLSGVVSLLKSVYTRVQVCRRTSSHIKQRWANRCAEEEKSEKNRSLEIGPAVWEEHTQRRGVRQVSTEK